MRRSRLFLLAAGAALAFAAAVCVGCKQEEEEEPWDAMVIKDGVLVRWRGAEGDVAIPNGVTSIGEDAFSGCTSLERITIPAGVTSIGRSAFSRCKSLASITIPAGVTSIGSYAFSSSSITVINFNGTTAGWKAITKGVGWNYLISPLIQCTDGNL
ncbi:MAG: leucine-rich repeat domain-containing protein [Treponemataceae bacterium]|nr:leucine-rich repeat domain-containing protein [Treponemataceae bacterium]